VLDAEQDLILGRGNQVRVRRRAPGGPGAALDRGVPADSVDELADSDSPDERAHIAVAAILAGPAPQREEGVLQRLIDCVGRSAPAGHPDLQPARMPVIQARQSGLIARRHGAQQRDVIGLRAHRLVHN
jgi:hypothetical protein